MTAARRIYLYLVAAVGLLLLTRGLSELARALIDSAATSSATVVSNLRDTVALNGAFVTLGLLGWLVHWSLAQRGARRDPAERAATLRRLFVYAVLAVSVLTAANALQALFQGAFALLGGRGSPRANGLAMLDALPRLVVNLAFWAYYLRVAAADRQAAGETGGAATLRRWYVYGVAFIGQMVLLFHARAILQTIWTLAATAPSQTILTGGETIAPSATTLTGLLLWASHWRLSPQSTEDPGLRTQDSGLRSKDFETRSVLRSVYLFLSLTVAVATTLYGGWQILFYALGRLLGVNRPGGVGGSLAQAAAGPVSLLCLYGVSWLYHRYAIQVQARAQPELPRQAGVRRLYVYLVSLVALSTLATGAGGLLWTVADLLTNAGHTINPETWWREQIALHTSLLVVGLPVWLLHWGPALARSRGGPVLSPQSLVLSSEAPVDSPMSPSDSGLRTQDLGLRVLDEAASLARRIYLYVALLGGVLALLGAGVTAVYQVYLLVLGAAATPGVMTNLARALAVATVAAVVVVYHLRTLRQDLEVQRTAAAAEPAPAGATPGAAPALVPSSAAPHGVVIRRAGRESSAWFATADEARDELDRIQGSAGGLEWAVLVKIDAQSEQPPASN